MKVAFAGQVEASVDPKTTRTDSLTIRFNIEDAYVDIEYVQKPEQRGRAWQVVNVDKAYKMLKIFADKYSPLLKAELQKLRREKRVRRN